MVRKGIPGALAKRVVAGAGNSRAVLVTGLGVNCLLLLGWEELMSLVAPVGW